MRSRAASSAVASKVIRGSNDTEQNLGRWTTYFKYLNNIDTQYDSEQLLSADAEGMAFSGHTGVRRKKRKSMGGDSSKPRPLQEGTLMDCNLRVRWIRSQPTLRRSSSLSQWLSALTGP